MARTCAALIAERQSIGAPYVRLALILGGVAVATALCALTFELDAMRVRYGRAARTVEPRDATC